MMLRRVSEVLEQHAEFQPNWKTTLPDTLAINPAFGAILHAVVCRADGSPIYDLPVWAEPRGAVIVPLLPDGRIVFIEHRRAVPFADGHATFPPSSLTAAGRMSLEVPRGFSEPGESPAETAVRETREETGYEVDDLTELGETNSNTTYYSTSIPVFLARLGHRGTPDSSDAEPISGCRPLSIPDVTQRLITGDIFCGITKSALLMYLAHSAQLSPS